MDENCRLRVCAVALALAGAEFIGLTSRSAQAADQVHDEIQVYNAEIADGGPAY